MHMTKCKEIVTTILKSHNISWICPADKEQEMRKGSGPENVKNGLPGQKNIPSGIARASHIKRGHLSKRAP